MSKRDLFRVFTAAYPAQPATAYWRAIEIGALASRAIPTGRGLDLGCGDGILTGILLDEIDGPGSRDFKPDGPAPCDPGRGAPAADASAAGHRDLVGIDLDPLETAAARRHPFYRAIHTCSADAIPEPDASFDFVISNSVLEHVPPLEGTMAEVGRLLKPAGRFYFTVPGPAFHDNLAGSLIPGTSRAAYLTALDARLAHFHYLSEDGWREMLDRHGLVLDRCFGYLDRAQTRRWETLSRFTGGLLYGLFGSSARPIEIQRKMGARTFQNRRRIPAPIAALIARAIRLGVPSDGVAWTPLDRASCLLIEGHRA